MTLKIITGNIFTTNAQTVVNTVNCVGVMGAGIALECRLRYPKMYERYVELCEKGDLRPGLLWLYKGNSRWILNFPTKLDWKAPSKIEYLDQGLQKFIATFEKRGIKSIAFPLLGADRGGLAPEKSLKIMEGYLSELPIDVEIYIYDRNAKDDLYDKTKDFLTQFTFDELVEMTTIKSTYLKRVIDAFEDDSFTQLNQLAQVKGVGINTIEKLFRFFQATEKELAISKQKSLF